MHWCGRGAGYVYDMLTAPDVNMPVLIHRARHNAALRQKHDFERGAFRWVTPKIETIRAAVLHRQKGLALADSF